MNLEEIKNNINEWIWDKDENTYFWLLSIDVETKKLRVRGLGGTETELFFTSGRFFKQPQKEVIR